MAEKTTPAFKWIPGTGFLVDGFKFAGPSVKGYFLSHAHSGLRSPPCPAVPAANPSQAKEYDAEGLAPERACARLVLAIHSRVHLTLRLLVAAFQDCCRVTKLTRKRLLQITTQASLRTGLLEQYAAARSQAD